MMEDPRFWLALGGMLAAYAIGLLRTRSLKAATASLRDRELPTKIYVEQGRVRIVIELDDEVSLVSVFGDATSRRIAQQVSEQMGEARDG
ncbi:hypothetical protein [Sorangium sp. So ce388]|uniref:hypothetical protein n=1 Tax=Sorangium sp. So ce388 TaxID=3133309 RepID=UPI003F5BA9CA